MTETNESVALDDRLHRDRETRTTLMDSLKEKSTLLRKEGDLMVEEYDEEIGALTAELRMLCQVIDADQPNEIRVEAHNYLRANAGVHFRPSALMAAVQSTGAVAAVVLAPFLQAGRVKRDGERRGTSYWVENESN